MTIAKIVLSFLALVALIVGTVWTLQGVNVLPGSFMTGHLEWAYRGAPLGVVGLLIMLWAFRTPGVLRGMVGLIGIVATLVGVVIVVRGMASTAEGHEKFVTYGAVAIVIGLLLEVWMTHAIGAAHNIFGSFGVLLILIGGIWVLQGLRLFPGTYMEGDMHWSYRGGVVVVLGAIMLLLAGRKARALAGK